MAPVVNALPNPRRAEPISDPLDTPRVRRLHCAFYNVCLAEAEKKDWPGFDCLACSVRRDLPAEVLREECGRIADLIEKCPRFAEPIRGLHMQDPKHRERSSIFDRRREIARIMQSPSRLRVVS